ncbi:MAG: hypothetical protein EXS64_07995 [Candidatus Latescibacteria bacterium]|nr:hypothetical protein [Candidatus Latescibacterota bacterium]
MSVDNALDPGLAKAEAETFWYDIQHLEVEGKGWADTKSFYDRFPARAEGVVREPVWNLSHHSAGMCVRFVTDAPAIQGRWTLLSENLAMNHMPATGVSGLDLYAKAGDGSWRWLGVGRPAAQTNALQLAGNLPLGVREYLLYLPLYNGVTSVEVGIPGDRKIAKGASRGPGREKPIVFYGTSITQGGCAARPGMAYPAIVGRRLGYPVINLGFSGNGKMEPEIASLLAELDPAIYVLDAQANMQTQEVVERAEPFVQTLRRAHADTPILLVEERTASNARLLAPQGRPHHAKRAALRQAYENLTAGGGRNLHYLHGDHLLKDDGEGTVDGSHPTDLGFSQMADAFEVALRPILGD